MKKINQNGFALVETLIVSVFVVTIFTMIFTNLYPLIGTYESIENYDDIDGKYAAYWVKRIMQDNITLSDVTGEISANKLYKFDCSKIINNDAKNKCENLISELSITNMYITMYNIKELKNSIDSIAIVSTGLKKYIKYQPDFSKNTSSGKYRVIIEMNRKEKDNADNDDTDPFIAYSTMEVNLR